MWPPDPSWPAFLHLEQILWKCRDRYISLHRSCSSYKRHTAHLKLYNLVLNLGCLCFWACGDACCSFLCESVKVTCSYSVSRDLLLDLRTLQLLHKEQFNEQNPGLENLVVVMKAPVVVIDIVTCAGHLLIQSLLLLNISSVQMATNSTLHLPATSW